MQDCTGIVAAEGRGRGVVEGQSFGRARAAVYTAKGSQQHTPLHQPPKSTDFSFIITDDITAIFYCVAPFFRAPLTTVYSKVRAQFDCNLTAIWFKFDVGRRDRGTGGAVGWSVNLSVMK